MESEYKEVKIKNKGKEYLAHKKLKYEAIDILLNEGFLPTEIETEKKIFINTNYYYIDVYAEKENEKICYELGITGSAKLDLLQREGFIVRELRYKDFEPSRSSDWFKSNMNLKEQKKYLKAVYNEEIYEVFKNDNFYNFEEYTLQNEDKFGLFKGRKEPFLNFNVRKISHYKELDGQLHVGIQLVDRDKFVIFITTDDLGALDLILEIRNDDISKLIDEYKKLRPYFYIRPAYAIPRKGNVTRGMKKISIGQIQANKMTKEVWYEITEKLEADKEISNYTQKYPRLDLLYVECNKKDIRFIIDEMKPIYQVLLQSEPKSKFIKEKICSLEKWQSKIEDNDFVEDLYRDNDWQCDYDTFKKIIKNLRKSDDYCIWHKENRY